MEVSGTELVLLNIERHAQQTPTYVVIKLTLYTTSIKYYRIMTTADKS